VKAVQLPFLGLFEIRQLEYQGREDHEDHEGFQRDARVATVAHSVTPTAAARQSFTDPKAG
jgi:hypothetical protein